MNCHFQFFLWKIWGKDISKLRGALFCFLGHRSHPISMDWSPENIDVHDLWILGTLAWNPYLWIWMYQITLGNLTTTKKLFQSLRNEIFEITGLWNLGILEFLNCDLKLKFRNFDFLRIHDTCNIQSNNLLITDYQWLMVRGSRLMSQGSRLKAQKIWR